jgi:hypothetical protein
MLISDCQIDGEMVPRVSMTIFRMRSQSVSQRFCQTYVVEPILAIQGVHAGVAANLVANDVWVLVQQVP